MSGLKNKLRSLVPTFLLEAYRRYKKGQRRKQLQKAEQAGHAVTKTLLVQQLQEMGIEPGANLLVHASMSKLGLVEGGANTVVEALLEVVGAGGTLLMPSSPNAKLQKDYARENPVYDVDASPSALGAISEAFRKMEGVQRSACPTEPVCAKGPMAAYFAAEHHLDPTPYGPHSPFYRLAEQGGKILYLGVTLDNAGTSLHVLEDAVDFPYPVYLPEPVRFSVRQKGKESQEVVRFIHNPAMSARRKCDQLIPMFAEAGVLQHTQLAQAKCLLLDAKGMLEVMVKAFHERGVTMYTPQGEALNL